MRQIIDKQIAQVLQSFKGKQGNQSKKSIKTSSGSQLILTTCNKKKGGKLKPSSSNKVFAGEVSKKTQTKDKNWKSKRSGKKKLEQKSES